MADFLFQRYQDVVDREFDFVVIGAGATGAALTHEISTRSPSARILVLDQGAFLLPGHVQNHGSVYQPLMDTAVAAPWRTDGDLELVGQVPYVGGRTLFWSGAAPTPDLDRFIHWPAEVVDDLRTDLRAARRLVGVRRASEVAEEFGALNAQLRDRIFANAEDVSCVRVPPSSEDLDAPLGMPLTGHGRTPVKYSAVPVLLEASRAHPTTIAVVPGCPVTRLEHRGGTVTALETGFGPLRVGGAKIVLAMGATENTRLVLASFLREVVPLAGSNLTANSAIFYMCRMPRSRFANLRAERPELAALYVDGNTDDREFVLHLSASATTDPVRDKENIYRLLPDVFGDGVVDRLADEEHVVFLVNGVAEIGGQRSADSPSRTHLDGNGTTVVDFRLDKSDHQALEALDRMTRDVLSAVADDGAVEYWSSENRRWVSSPPSDPRMPFALSEGGTLWMGSSADTSVTDLDCRLHNVENVHVAGAAVFPAHGAWNPLLTMTALAMRLGRHLTS